MTQYVCPRCRRIHYGVHNCMKHIQIPGVILAPACQAGVDSHTPVFERTWADSVKQICLKCPHVVKYSNEIGCELAPNKPCDLGIYRNLGRACFDDPPRYAARPKPYELPDFNIEVSSGKRAIVTCIVGDNAKAQATHSLETIEAYADKCKADLYVIDEDKYNVWPIANKFATRSVAQAYDRTLFIDIDCIVKKSCPDMFSTFPSGYVWMYCEREYAKNYSHLNHDSAILQRKNTLKGMNSGVALIDRAHADIWLPPKFVKSVSHTLEQSIVEFNVNDLGFEYGLLHKNYNLQYWFRDAFWDSTKYAHIIHLSTAKHETRMRLLPFFKD